MNYIILSSQEEIDVLCLALGIPSVMYSGTTGQSHYYSPTTRFFGVFTIEQEVEFGRDRTMISLMDYLGTPSDYGSDYGNFFVVINDEEEFKQVLELITKQDPFIYLIAQNKGYEKERRLMVNVMFFDDRYLRTTLEWDYKQPGDDDEVFSYEEFIEKNDKLIPPWKVYKISNLELGDEVDKAQSKEPFIEIMQAVREHAAEQGFYVASYKTPETGVAFSIYLHLTPWSISVIPVMDGETSNELMKYEFFAENVTIEDFLGIRKST